MTTTSFFLGLFAPLGLFTVSVGAAHAQANDMFPTKAAAEQRAKELKCSGAFAMGGEWMPCANERSLHGALQKEK
jgi:hypothetical protein